MSKAKCRTLINRKNLVKFFVGNNKYGRPRLPALELFEPARFLELARLYLDSEEELEHVFSYVRRFKQATRELDESDAEEALNELHVRGVMES